MYMKKFIVSLMMLLPLCVVAQETKIAHVDVNEIIGAMPEYVAMQNELDATQRQAQEFLRKMNDDLVTKYNDLTEKQDSLPPNILQYQVQEIEQLRERIETFQQTAYQDLQKKQQELFIPIEEKVFRAINQVGEENGFLYILHQQAILYVGKTAVNATGLVRTKLGLN
jgi:outer membrane protein